MTPHARIILIGPAVQIRQETMTATILINYDCLLLRLVMSKVADKSAPSLTTSWKFYCYSKMFGFVCVSVRIF